MNKVATVVGKGGGEVKTSESMLCPGGSISRALVDNNKLSGGVNGVSSEIYRGAVKAVVGGDVGVKFIGDEMVKGEGGVVKEEVPEVKGKKGMDTG